MLVFALGDARANYAASIKNRHIQEPDMPMNPQDRAAYAVVNNIIELTGCDKSKFDDILEQVCEGMAFAGSYAVCYAFTEVFSVDLLSLCQKFIVAREDQERRIEALPPEPTREQSGGDAGGAV
jgi:hypothetical protein